jgi:hypothetical protein
VLLSEEVVADGEADDVVDSGAETMTVTREPCAFVDVIAEVVSEVTDEEDNADNEDELSNELVDDVDEGAAEEVAGVDVDAGVEEGGELDTTVVATGLVEAGCDALTEVLCAGDDCAGEVAGWVTVTTAPCLRTMARGVDAKTEVSMRKECATVHLRMVERMRVVVVVKRRRVQLESARPQLCSSIFTARPFSRNLTRVLTQLLANFKLLEQ